MIQEHLKTIDKIKIISNSNICFIFLIVLFIFSSCDRIIHVELFDKNNKKIDHEKKFIIEFHNKKIAEIKININQYFGGYGRINKVESYGSLCLKNITLDTLYFNPKKPFVYIIQDTLMPYLIQTNFENYTYFNSFQKEGLYHNYSYIPSDSMVFCSGEIIFETKKNNSKYNLNNSKVVFYIHNLFYKNEEIISDTFYIKPFIP